jgi:RNA 2',3'-cyclic 3'-phosphodiesterase
MRCGARRCGRRSKACLSANRVRLFFALWPDVDVVAQLSGIAASLDLRNSATVPSSNYHLTLAFVGEVPRARLAVLQQIGAAQRSARFSVELDAIEYWRESRVIVASAQRVPAAMLGLWVNLHKDLALPYRSPFLPHVTLARKVTQASGPQAMSAFLWSATNFSLILSEKSGSAPAYTVVDTWSLLDETAIP